MIHGDYSLRNIIYNGKIWNIDFDENRVHYRCFEVAKFIINIFQQYNYHTAKNIKDFLNGYNDIANLSMDEMKKMFYVYAVSLANDESGITDIGQFKNYLNYQKFRIK